MMFLTFRIRRFRVWISSGNSKFSLTHSHTPWRLAILLSLPMLLYSLANLLSCCNFALDLMLALNALPFHVPFRFKVVNFLGPSKISSRVVFLHHQAPVSIIPIFLIPLLFPNNSGWLVPSSCLLVQCIGFQFSWTVLSPTAFLLLHVMLYNMPDMTPLAMLSLI